ncbi:hypothetical protein [Noviherbaspirillum autotrophicum]|uniref:hypothetical protein n=1 Tax=Noviherbaspirillum autotrophicum TaxID=709839 RepID=UPI000B93A818|nr:hypothetical protein [Noviherbaspirillum autotrophicum]
MTRTFRNLPITPEQDAEIREYIASCEAQGCAWDTLALDYMINDFLYPSPNDDRIDFCDGLALELAGRYHLTSEEPGTDTQEQNAMHGDVSEIEWKWIVREARKYLVK